MKKKLVLGRRIGEAINYRFGEHAVLMTILRVDSKGVVFMLENKEWGTQSPYKTICLGARDRYEFGIGTETVELSMSVKAGLIKVGSLVSELVHILRDELNVEAA